MRQQEARSDPFRRLALQAGFKSRAAFKLIEMDSKFRLLRQGYRVVDLGSAPGSWLQVAVQRVGPKGLVIGVDILPIKISAENVLVVKDDIRSRGLPEGLRSAAGGEVDVVLLDAAPKFAGIEDVDEERQVELIRSGLDIAKHILKKHGSAVFKALEGARTSDVEALLRNNFNRVVRYRPTAVRKHSREFYFVCTGYSTPLH